MMATVNQSDDDDGTKMQDARGDSPSHILQVMNTYGREFWFILAVVFTAFAALQNSPPKTRRANPPQKFLSSSSLVSDFYFGNLQALNSQISENDVAAVLYYAPWDAGSMHAQEEFEIVARFYHTEIYFAAINCWWPEGECHKTNKIVSYPVILVYVHQIGNIKYQGPMVANYIITFLDHIITPFVPIHSQGELLDLQTRHEAVLVGFFDFHGSLTPSGYSEYYETSLKALSRDPTRRIAFAIITSKKTATKLKMSEPFSITFYLWNETEIYSGTELKADEILKWIFKKFHQITSWLTPPGTKSSLLSQIVEQSPTLLLFTPRNLMADLSPYYDLLRETALDFYNCNSSAWITSIVHHIVLKRYALEEDLIHIKENCAAYLASMQHYKNCKSCVQVCCQSLSGKQFSLNKCLCTACLHSKTNGNKQKASKGNCDRTILKLLKHIKFPSHYSAFHSCSIVNFSYPLNYGSFHHMSLNCYDEKPSSDNISSSEVSQIGIQDDRVIKLLHTIEKKKCRHFFVAMNYSDVTFPKFSHFPSISHKNFSGLGCRTNRTLTFVAMDAIQFHTFAEHLGVDILRQPYQTVAVILEAKQESQYLLSGEINKKILAEFILSYTESSLNRHLRSAVRYQLGCGVVPGGNQVCVHELTTDQFEKIVLDPEKDVIVMYYAPWCGYCSSIAHVFLTVASYFAGISGIIFVRINGDDHDLPWKYTVDKYPSILFFPAKRKSESLEFPSSLPITPVNLLHFVLINAQPKVRWKIALQLCNHNCIIYNHVRTTSKIQHLFRELHLLLTQFHFVQEHLYKSRKMRIFPIGKRSTNLFKEDKRQLQQEMLIEYQQWLVEKIRDKKQKIRRARHLQTILKEKGSLMIAEKLIYIQKTNTSSVFNKNNSDSNTSNNQSSKILDNNRPKTAAQNKKDEL